MGGIGVKDADAALKDARHGAKDVGSDVKNAEADVKNAEKMLRTLGPDVKNAKTVLRTLDQNVKKAMVLSSKRALRALNHGIRSEAAQRLEQRSLPAAASCSCWTPKPTRAIRAKG